MSRKRKIIGGILLLLFLCIAGVFIYLKAVIPPGEEWLAYNSGKITADIDRQLEDDLAYASSNASIQEAYDNAARRWEQLIENAVAAGEENFTGDQLTTFQKEQTAWEDGLDAAVEEIRADNTDDPMAAAQQVVEYYRTRAKDLCQQVYQATAKMPEFPSVDTEPLG